MIVGIFNFITSKIPSLLKQLFINLIPNVIKLLKRIFKFIWNNIKLVIKYIFLEWSPLVVKILKIVFLFVVWTLLLLAPVLYFIFDSNNHSLPTLFNLSEIELYVCILWLSVGLVGSGWGLIKLKQKA
jgi:hypothetical protein